MAIPRDWCNVCLPFLAIFFFSKFRQLSFRQRYCSGYLSCLQVEASFSSFRNCQSGKIKTIILTYENLYPCSAAVTSVQRTGANSLVPRVLFLPLLRKREDPGNKVVAVNAGNVEAGRKLFSHLNQRHDLKWSKKKKNSQSDSTKRQNFQLLKMDTCV